jgi:shikimate dehydrogenase
LLAYNARVSEPFREPIGASTRYCAVYGHPVRHSASPAMQNAGIARLGLNWRYLAFEVHPDELSAAIEGARAMRFIGLNLTVPHKILAVEMVDFIEESAALYGAVNTIRFEGKDGEGNWKPLADAEESFGEIRSHGFNTDADAITRSLTEDLGIDLAGKRALVLGAGGAGRTAALKLAEQGVAELFLVNRTESKAEEVAREVKRRAPAVKVKIGYPAGRIDLLLNATSLGLKSEDTLPFDEKEFQIKNAAAVYDMIYRPAETPLLKAARAKGCRTANGLGMLLYQGAKSLEIWSGRDAPIETMREALKKNVYS